MVVIGGMGYRVTIDHEEIKRWVKEHGGEPAIFKAASMPAGGHPSEDSAVEDSGILRIKFRKDDKSTPIAWQEFLDRFESGKLAFRYTDKVKKGEEELAFTFADRDAMGRDHDDLTALPDDNDLAEENMFPSKGAAREE
jgi:hypothetical protein